MSSEEEVRGIVWGLGVAVVFMTLITTYSDAGSCRAARGQ